MSLEEEFLEYIQRGIELPADAPAREEFVVEMTREQYESFLCAEHAVFLCRACWHPVLLPLTLPDE